MARHPTDWNREWQGLEPPDDRPARPGRWLAVVLLLFLLLAICALSAFLAWQQIGGDLLPGVPTLAPPTTPGAVETAVPAATFPIAPTATLAPP